MRYTYPDWPDWPTNRTVVIAEVGMNHGGNEALAWEMINSAHENGADLVKLQSFVTEDFFHPSLSYFQNTKAMELPLDGQRRLFAKGKEAGINLITTPFGVASVDMVEEFEPLAFKVASMDNDNHPLIEHIAKKGRPILISLGMADLGEIQKTVDVVRKAGNEKLVLLHCISDYPSRLEDMHLASLQGLRQIFNVHVGLSDHSMGLDAAFAAASMGVAVIEKHFTTDRKLCEEIPDADHDISIEPDELRDLRRFCESVTEMIGSFPRPFTENEATGRNEMRRGLYAKQDIEAGEPLSLDNVAFLRPVRGVRAGDWRFVQGRKSRRKIEKSAAITFADVGL